LAIVLAVVLTLLVDVDVEDLLLLPGTRSTNGSRCVASFQYRSWWNHRKELSTSVPSPAAAVEVDVVVVVVDDGVVAAEQVTGVAGEEEEEGCVTNMTVGVGAVVWIRLTDETAAAAGDGLGRIIA
jgi:hypothetical protein